MARKPKEVTVRADAARRVIHITVSYPVTIGAAASVVAGLIEDFEALASAGVVEFAVTRDVVTTDIDAQLAAGDILVLPPVELRTEE